MDIESVGVAGFLLAMPWPFWRLAGSAPVRYRRRDQVALLAVLGTYVLLILIVATRWKAGLIVLAAVAAATGVVLWWRSRSGFGRRDNVPPGRILVHPLGPFEEVDHLSRQAARYGPIFKIGATFPVPTMTPIVCVVGHDLGLELLRDHEGSLEVYPPFPTNRLIPRGFLRNMTVADHERYAPIFRQAFATCADASFDQAVAMSARLTVARMRADSAASGGRGIAPEPYLRAFAFDVLARLLFGHEPGSIEQRRLADLYRELDIKQFARWTPQRTRRQRWSTAVRDLESAFEPGATPASRSVLAETLAAARRGGGGIDEDTIVGNVLQMQESGTGDLSSLLVWVVKHLADHPVWIEHLREASTNPGDGADFGGAPRPLGERVIRESLRLEQSEFLNRRTTEDIRFHGYLLPKGWRVRICIREAHRSPDVFERPTEFDPDRFLRNPHPPAEYAPFGLYRHRCLAARLVQRIGAAFVEELARDGRLTVVQDGPRVHGRFHWQPSPRLRVSLEPRTD